MMTLRSRAWCTDSQRTTSGSRQARCLDFGRLTGRLGGGDQYVVVLKGAEEEGEGRGRQSSGEGCGREGKKQWMGQPLSQTHPQGQEGLSGERLEGARFLSCVASLSRCALRFPWRREVEGLDYRRHVYDSSRWEKAGILRRDFRS